MNLGLPGRNEGATATIELGYDPAVLNAIGGQPNRRRPRRARRRPRSRTRARVRRGAHRCRRAGRTDAGAIPGRRE